MSTTILDIDLARGPQDVDHLAPATSALVLLRWRGKPLGQVRMEVRDGSIRGADLWRAASEALGQRLTRAALTDMLPQEHSQSVAERPSCSVIICTRNRTEDLRRCLDALCAVAGAEVEIIVVDNAPSDDRTAHLVEHYPVRYCVEPRPGLNWARGHGARLATGEIVIYTDDDVVVDAGWIDAMCAPFGEPQVAAVTGLVMPLELQNEAQELFERYGGLGRGFERREYTAQTIAPAAAANIGAGANMAFRRHLVNQMGLFDVELDCGTAALTGGDTYAFYRLLWNGHRIVYTPDALVWHRHRQTVAELYRALYGYAVGTYVFLLRCLLHHGDLGALYVGWWWFRHEHLRQLWLSLRHHPDAHPRPMITVQIRGCFDGLHAYIASYRAEKHAICS